MTDANLLAEFVAQRDDSAFDALVRRHGPMVFRVCRDVLGDREHAEDAFQATFLVLVRRAGSIHDRASIGRWLYEVALRISRRERRRLARLRSQERQVPEMEATAPPGPDHADRELKPILHQEIGRLPSKLREAIVLRYLQDLTVEAAARKIGCPVGTFKSRLGKGRELLRARLTRRGVPASVLLLLLSSLAKESSAAVPDSLVEATLRADSHRQGGVGVSRRVASMVTEEEGRNRWLRMTGPCGLVAALLLLFGVSRMAPGRKADGTTAPPPVDSPAGHDAATSRSSRPTAARPTATTQDFAPGVRRWPAAARPIGGLRPPLRPPSQPVLRRLTGTPR